MNLKWETFLKEFPFILRYIPFKDEIPTEFKVQRLDEETLKVVCSDFNGSWSYSAAGISSQGNEIARSCQIRKSQQAHRWEFWKDNGRCYQETIGRMILRIPEKQRSEIKYILVMRWRSDHILNVHLYKIPVGFKTIPQWMASRAKEYRQKELCGN